MTKLPRELDLIEVGPRDGFQMEATFIPTELKVAVIDQLAAAGLREIEAVSFVNPRVIPQMSDADQVMAQLDRREGVTYWALVPNLRGAMRALEAGMNGIHQVICCSETYNQRNVGLSIDESLQHLTEVVAVAQQASSNNVGSPVTAVTMAATFGCPFEGQKSDDRLVELAARIAATGVDQLGLADSAGLGHPELVKRIIAKIQQALPAMDLRLHLHDTRGLGIANAVAAMGEGIARFDTSLGGLGGCPMMRGASGNIATEDLNNLCLEMGIETGVSTEGVCTVARQMAAFLGRPLPSRLLSSGTREQLYALNRVGEGPGEG
jgi:hydroxymethylglutaryl-CoA lyase